MLRKNKVFIATSLDGYIADENGGIDWLHSFPNPENEDMGYNAFMSKIDAIIMGRATFETVCGFEIDWPYQKKVFVLSNSISVLPEKYSYKAEIISGDLRKVINSIHNQGYNTLYVDGGKTIQSFLNEDLIDEMTITIIPVILGGGVPLFSFMAKRLDFECVSTQLFLGKIAQNHYIRKR